jgi:tripeptidyl-peptidase-1
VDSGIAEERVKLSKSRTWIRLNLTVGEAENLLKTKYQVFEHQKMGKRSLACDEYSVPVTVQDHIDFISPTTQFKLELMMQNKQTVAKKRDFGIGADPPPTQILTSSAADFPLPPNGTNIPFWDLATCNKAITPSCIQSLYRLPNGTENL